MNCNFGICNENVQRGRDEIRRIFVIQSRKAPPEKIVHHAGPECFHCLPSSCTDGDLVNSSITC